ncbi:AAA family ATPase [Cetobacterium sp.]|uniref:AAA family ATPase n=1 Tax=Cetobacterium sp. TaxID=2071632 RepID=UPI003F2A2261
MQKINKNIEVFRMIEKDLKSVLIGKNREIEFLLYCVLAQTPILFIGEPGTGKSLLINEFIDIIGMDSNKGDYFHYLLTRFTEPSELFGPLNINKLVGDGGDISYSRLTKGKLPEAKVAFLDEVFKANSAILNTLLTVVNEKKYHNDGKWSKVPLKFLIAASNEMPEDEELKAFLDRIVIRVYTDYLSLDKGENLKKLVLSAMKKNKVEKRVRLNSDEFFKMVEEMKEYVDFQIESLLSDEILKDYLARKLSFIRSASKSDPNISAHISDRKVLPLLQVMAARAILKRGVQSSINRDDIAEVLKMTWDRVENIPDLERFIDDETND